MKPVRACLSILLAAISFRTALMVLLPLPDSMIDSYDAISANIISGGGFAFSPGVPTIARGPVYPAFVMLGALSNGDGKIDFGMLRVMSILLDSGTALLAGWIASRIAGWSAGVRAGLLYALNPAAAYYCVKLGSETLTGFLLLLLASLSARAVFSGKSSTSLQVASGLTAGVLTLAKSSFIPAALLFLAAPHWHLRRSRGPGRSSAGVLLPLAVMLLVIIPWTVRNLRVSGRLVPVQTMAGFNFWYDFGFDRNRDEALASRDPGAVFTGDAVRVPSTGEIYSQYTHAAPEDALIDAELVEAAVDWSVRHPLGFLAKCADNIASFWIAVETPAKMAVAAVLSSLLLCMAFAGFLRLRRIRGSGGFEAVLGWSIVLHVLVHAPVFAVFRYCLPVLPLLSCLAAFATGDVTAQVQHPGGSEKES